jgi:hypothetical protein
MSKLRSRIHTDDGQERAPTPRQVQKEGLQLERWTVELYATTTIQHLSSFDSRGDSAPTVHSDDIFSTFLLFTGQCTNFSTGTFFESRQAAAFRFGEVVFTLLGALFLDLGRWITWGFTSWKEWEIPGTYWAKIAIRFIVFAYTIASRPGIGEQAGIKSCYC